jgi:hypothetical protein
MKLFSPERRATFLAAADRIIPGDDFPSASAAGAEQYVLRLLAGDLRERADEFLAGLDLLNDESAAMFQGQRFAALSEAQQDALLSSLESHPAIAARAFFKLLVELVTEGYYADAANGGNRDALSWKMIGYDPGIPDAPNLIRGLIDRE